MKQLAAQGRVWTQIQEAAVETRELDVPPHHLMLHLMLKGPERRERRQSEREETSQEGQGVGQAERINSSQFNRGVIQDKG